MKIYIDNIYTATPKFCSGHAMMKKIVAHLLEVRSDVYIYWQVPDNFDDEMKKDFIDSDRIVYIKYPYLTHDRLREYLRCDRELYKNLFFSGKYWDVDVLLTSRTSQVASLKAGMLRPSSNRLRWSKRIVLLEVMPMMGFKLTVAISSEREQELASLFGYLAADTTIVGAFWEKKYIMEAAKRYLSAASVNEIGKRMIEGSPVVVNEFGKKTEEFITDNERPFTIGFVGRVTHNTRSDDIFELMGKHWIYRHGRKIRCVALTQSIAKEQSGTVKRIGRVDIPEWMEVFHFEREKFWEFVKQEVDVIVFMSPEEDYSMSLMEPMILGTPAVVVDCRWSRPTLGNEYPFFASGMTQAYGLVNMFFHDYAKMYAKFSWWVDNCFTTIMKKRNEVYMPTLMEDECRKWDQDLGDATNKDTLANNTVVKLLAQKDEIHLFDDLMQLEKEGKLDFLGSKAAEGEDTNRKLTFGTPWNSFRLGLMYRGYEDASAEVGHMRKTS